MTMNNLILNIPHAAKVIPPEYLPFFTLNKTDLNHEILKMTDHFTDALFQGNTTKNTVVSFPVSRLLVDPERFENDADEPMASRGMGCIYAKTHDGKDLKNGNVIRNELIEKFYRPHHRVLHEKVKENLHKHNSAIIIDCHSFPKYPLPYELDQTPNRSEICVGTDSFHTPSELTDFMIAKFKGYGLGVSVNTPFSGSMVPYEFMNKNKRVRSIMIEVRRDLYMDESSGNKSSQFNSIQQMICEIIDQLELFVV